MKKRIAIVLFNLGGPKNLKSVKPFLFNLFYDKAIINLPNPLRYIIAKIISITRERKSQKIYSLIGGKSSLLQETEEQKLALTEKLKQLIKEDFAIFINMRYSAPFAKEVINQIKKYNPSEIILLPLYPQFSSTTTGSSVKNFLQNFDIDIPIKTICCYPLEEDFIKSHVSLIKEKLYDDDKNFRILFSAHGLPEKIIKAGDPYSFQIKETVKAIVKELNIKDLDYKITYQSRVGPVEWLKPNTEDEIELAGKLKKDIIIVPISFVSEHVETLVELDIEYKLIADKYEIQYIRIPTLGTNKIFINSLTNILLQFINKVDTNLVTSSSSTRICPNEFTKCLCKLTRKRMASYYLWFKSVHLISAICWMAGLLYLPRIYVYHTKAKIGSGLDNTLQVMELKLLRFIMNPAMISTFIFGLINAHIYGFVALGTWFHVKMFAVLILMIFHGLLARWRKDFANGKNVHSEKFYRIVNEIPAICMIVAVIMVIVKPFD